MSEDPSVLSVLRGEYLLLSFIIYYSPVAIYHLQVGLLDGPLGLEHLEVLRPALLHIS